MCIRVERLVRAVVFVVEFDQTRVGRGRGDGQSQALLLQHQVPSFPREQHVVDVLANLLDRDALEALQPLQQLEHHVFLGHDPPRLVQTSTVTLKIAVKIPKLANPRENRPRLVR